jgi:predicted AAA+ superfamily ATPase
MFLGPRFAGKHTILKMLPQTRNASFLRLETLFPSPLYQNLLLAFRGKRGLIVSEGTPPYPGFLAELHKFADRQKQIRFLFVGNFSPDTIYSPSIAGQKGGGILELSPFDISEVAPWDKVWIRGGFPSSFLARSEGDSLHARDEIINRFVDRDVYALGFHPTALRRFITSLASFHSQVWNASKVARAAEVSYKTANSYLDLLEGSYWIRRIPAWQATVSKRQVKAPKVFFRDSGLLHSLLAISDSDRLFSHPIVAASWEGFALEQILRILRPREYFHWSTYQGAKIDLVLPIHHKRVGVKMVFQEIPSITPSMRMGLEDLQLHHLWVVHPGKKEIPLDRRITAIPIHRIPLLAKEMQHK